MRRVVKRRLQTRAGSEGLHHHHHGWQEGGVSRLCCPQYLQAGDTRGRTRKDSPRPVEGLAKEVLGGSKIVASIRSFRARSS